jgi:2-keto-3-deoxy-L-rhamnonate aldolase RhmA
MRTNEVKRKLMAGKPVLGTMISDLRSLTVIQVLAHAGYDFVFIDMEHGPFRMEAVADLIRVARLASFPPFVRVPDLAYPFLARPLDAGAMGLMIPRVESRQQVEHIVDCMRYPPVGSRGCSVARGHNDFLSEPAETFTAAANKEVMVIIQIERRAAIDDIEGLLSVPGVDAAVMGLNDLSLSLGISSNPLDPASIAATEKVVAAGQKHGVPTGLHTNNLDAIRYWAERGMRVLAHQTDLGLLSAAAGKSVADLRQISDGIG